MAWRELVGYWLLGLTNNYGYVVMLTAAHDIIFDLIGNEETNQTVCNSMSTGAILLADIVPTLVIKLIVPFVPFHVHYRVAMTITLSVLSFILVASAKETYVAILGVICTSLSSGLGESTFLSYTAIYNKNVVSTWSSGTGGAGIIGAVTYAGLTELGLSVRATIMIMLLIPFVEAVAFWGLLKHPSSEVVEDFQFAVEDNNELWKKIKAKLKFIPHLCRYIMPLTVVYFLEYFINQGLYQFVYFPKIFLTQPEQYRWFQVSYQIGVFVSRSSVNLLHVQHLWVFSYLQAINVAFFLLEVFLKFTPSIWLVFIIILWEGLLGGGAYVNTFYNIAQDLPAERQIFAMALTTLADTLGITLAGVVALPVHRAICSSANYSH